MNKTNVTMNKPVYLGLLILDLSKIAMYEYWYDYAKPKYRDNAKLCYMDTDNFILKVKSEDIYADLEENIETRFDASNNDVDSPLPIGKSKQIIRLMKDEFGGRIMKEFIALNIIEIVTKI